MKWTKLEYGKWPEGEIVMRIKEPKGQIWYQVGIISQHLKNKEWYFYLSYALTSKVSIDSIYDTEPHYIELDAIEMPDTMNNMDCNTKTVNHKYVIHKEPRIVKEDFKPRLPSWIPINKGDA